MIQEVMTMLASTPGMGVALPNLAFSLIMKSVQQMPAASHSPVRDRGIHPATPALADSHQMQHVDVKA